MNQSLRIPFSLRIFVADGDPDGLRIVDKSNWIGKALVFPRAPLPCHRALSHVKTESGYFPLWIKHLASHVPVHVGLQLLLPQHRRRRSSGPQCQWARGVEGGRRAQAEGNSGGGGYAVAYWNRFLFNSQLQLFHVDWRPISFMSCFCAEIHLHSIFVNREY